MVHTGRFGDKAVHGQGGADDGRGFICGTAVKFTLVEQASAASTIDVEEEEEEVQVEVVAAAYIA